MSPAGRVALLLTGWLAGCAAVTVEPPRPQQLSSFSSGAPGTKLPDGWQPWTLSPFKKPTLYQFVQEAGRTVVQADAEGSASGLIHRIDVDPRSYPVLTWRWKVPRLIDGADNTLKQAEDSPVRVAVTFDGDFERLPLADRIFRDHVRLLSGQQLPYATLIYIWENRVPVGTVIPNQHTSRVRMIVAESGTARVGSWQELTRSLLEDFRRAFGEEPGRVTAIGIMTDSDNTGQTVRAYYGDIRLERSRSPQEVLASEQEG